MEWNKNIFYASLGGMIEFFEFTLAIFMIPILSNIFFSEENHKMAMLAMISSFALGYICRPIGGIIFSHFGDRFGRKNAFLSTITMISLATLGIGILPGYQQIGILSPILLISLRILQGISFGGDIGTVVPYILEITKGKQKFLAGALLLSIILIGALLASIIVQLMNFFIPKQIIYSYGWRIVFIIAGLTGIISIPLRKRLHESIIFLQIKEKGELAKIPFLLLFKNHSIQLIIVFICSIPLILDYNYLFMLLPIYMENISFLTHQEIWNIQIIASLIHLLCILFFARLNFRYSPVTIIIIGYTLSCIITFPTLMYFFSTLNFSNVTLCIAWFSFAIINSIHMSCCYVYISLTFPCNIRCNATSLIINFIMLLCGIIYPIFTEWMNIQDTWLYPLFVMLLINGIALIFLSIFKIARPKILTK